MIVLRTREDVRHQKPKRVCIAIGVFDGIHLGHQQVIRQTVSDAARHEATPCVVTFDRHPSSIVNPGRTPPLIYSLPQKLRTIEGLGVEWVWLIHFDKAFSQIPGPEFIASLVEDFHSIQSICVGRNFTFGHKRSGNVELLRSLGTHYNYAVRDLAAVALDQQTVSSTRVRQAIRLGQLDQAGQMLGRTYSLAGQVVRGDQLGTQLGFPTANLDVTGLVLPPNGVYAVHAATPHGTHRALLNIGVRPTVDPTALQPRAEAHLLDFNGDLYGQELEITFVEKLRDEMRFPSLDALKARIARDITGARAIFSLAP